jgi:uncharacterized protein
VSARRRDAEIRRLDLRFESGGESCAAWLFMPPGERLGLPCVVLAHGLGATREGRLAEFAERFAQGGIAAFVFDYRHFGDSAGMPRQLVDIGSQLLDWQNAIRYVRSQPAIDSRRVALWGTSFSGGHVVEVAARDDAVAAVISMNPFLDGRYATRSAPVGPTLKLVRAGLRDALGALLGRTARLVPAIGPAGTTALMAGPDAVAGFEAMFPPDRRPSPEVAARIVLRLPTYRPGKLAAQITVPWLIQPGSTDTRTGTKPALDAAERAAKATVRLYDGDHFAPYVEPCFDHVVRQQVEFLTEHLLEGADSGPQRS